MSFWQFLCSILLDIGRSGGVYSFNRADLIIKEGRRELINQLLELI